MSEHYDFHYQPTGSGAISGQQVLQQTEDAINELGDYVNDNVGGAMDVAQQALETAQNAETNAQTALDTANSFSDAIQSAQQDASTALSTAQTAQTTASNASNTANQASQDANTAVTTANNASGQVSTLSGTVTALGQRVTTAEGNIGQNTSDITALGQRVTTAEGNITTLQNDVSIAQGNASSAMATAGQVKQQAFVFRYSSTALVASSTNSNTLLDNTDNLKVGDKVIDSNGVLFSVTAIDTQNSTFTIGTALIDLAQDSDVVHKSGDETISGQKVFDDINTISSSSEIGVSGGSNSFKVLDKNKKTISRLEGGTFSTGIVYSQWLVNNGTDVFNGMSLYQPSANLAQLRPYSPTLSLQLGASNRPFSDCYTSKINGLEPSALSLPSGNASDFIDISSYISALDGTDNLYTAPANGWVTIAVGSCSTISCIITGYWSDNRIRTTSGNLRMMFPILKNQVVKIQIMGGTIDYARFIPCQGNV